MNHTLDLLYFPCIWFLRVLLPWFGNPFYLNLCYLILANTFFQLGFWSGIEDCPEKRASIPFYLHVFFLLSVFILHLHLFRVREKCSEQEPKPFQSVECLQQQVVTSFLFPFRPTTHYLLFLLYLSLVYRRHHD